jgi:hypothetical protein
LDQQEPQEHLVQSVLLVYWDEMGQQVSKVQLELVEFRVLPAYQEREASQASRALQEILALRERRVWPVQLGYLVALDQRGQPVYKV